MKRYECIVFFCLAALAVLVGCGGGERACSTDDDCFSGEQCVEGLCTEEGGSGNNGPGSNNGAGSNNGGTNNGVANNGATNNGATNNGATNNGSSNNGGGSNGAACVVDPFQNQCTEDDFEQPGSADDYQQQILPYEAASWCSEGNLVNGSRTFSATYCAGDDMDAYRFLIDNRTPDQCLEGRFTMIITVEIDTPCERSLINVQVYDHFRDPVRYDLCEGEFAEVRCSESSDGSTRVFEWLFDSGSELQLPEASLLVETPGRDDVQFDYDVTVEIIPQN